MDFQNFRNFEFYKFHYFQSFFVRNRVTDFRYDMLKNDKFGFREGDSCISQLLSITHDIFTGFDANPPLDTRGVFLDISKAFDRVWHDGLIFKLKSYGVTGPFLSLIRNFLTDRYQRVVLKGKHLSGSGSMLGYLKVLFLVLCSF